MWAPNAFVSFAYSKDTLADAKNCFLYWGPVQPLRMLDALHLSLALDLHENTSLNSFVGSDLSLNKIVTLEGLSVINPETV